MEARDIHNDGLVGFWFILLDSGGSRSCTAWTRHASAVNTRNDIHQDHRSMRAECNNVTENTKQQK